MNNDPYISYWIKGLDENPPALISKEESDEISAKLLAAQWALSVIPDFGKNIPKVIQVLDKNQEMIRQKEISP